MFFSGLIYLFCYSPQRHLLVLVCVCSSVDCFCYSPQQTLLGLVCVCSCLVFFVVVVVNVAIVHNKVYWVWFVYVLEWTGVALFLFCFFVCFPIVHNRLYWVWFVYVLEWMFYCCYSPQQRLLGLVCVCS